MNKFVQWILNIVVGVVSFVFFVLIFFPAESMVHYWISQLEKQSGGQYRLTVGDIEAHVFLKSQFKNCKFYKKVEGQDVLMADFQNIKVGLKYWPLLLQKAEASYEALSKKGSIEGLFSFSQTELYVEAKIKNLDLDTVPYLSTLAHVPLKGVLSGEIDLTLVSETPSKSDGFVDLKLVNLIMPQTRLAPAAGVEIDMPDLTLAEAGGARIKAKIKEGKIEFEDVNMPGPDILLALKGTLQLNKKFVFSKLNIAGTFNFSDKVKEAVPLILVLDAQKNPEGAYPLTISGRMAKPQIQIGSMDIGALMQPM